MSYRILALLIISLGTVSSTAMADWSLNLGYNNPPGATLGINFLYWGSKLGFEVGVGWVDADASVDDDDEDDLDDDDDDNASLALAGDIDVKYFFSSGGVAPFVQGGFGLGIAGQVGDDSGASAGLGGGYVGLGLMAGGKDLYLYLSGNMTSHQHAFAQVGVGFDI